MRALSLLTALFAATPALAEGPTRPSGGPRVEHAAPAKPQKKPSKPPAARVTVGVQVVHATDSEEGIDPRLDALASSFRYFKYKGYRLLSSESRPLAVGGSATFEIAGERELTVTVVERDDERARVRVEIVKGENRLLDTTVSINRDGTFIVAGPKYRDGILMLPLRASY